MRATKKERYTLFRVSQLFLLGSFVVLVAAVLLMSVLGALELFKVLTGPTQQFAKYPFGTESGYLYCSRETYSAFVITFFCISVQALIISVLLYRSHRAVIAISALLFPVMLYVFLTIAYGNPH